MTSVELNRALGAFVLERVPTRVDSSTPEQEIHVEVLPAETYISLDRVEGRAGARRHRRHGGDTALGRHRLAGGRVADDEARLPRDLRALPQRAVPARDLAGQGARARRAPHRVQVRLAPAQVAFGEIQREVVLSVPPPLRVVVYRRLMIRIAEELARRSGALALATGESLGQVASQTLENIARIDEAATLPVLRPLIGMDKLEITAQAQRIGTFDISIEPGRGLLHALPPRHPATRTGADEIRAAEAGLDLDRLVKAGVDGAAVEVFAFPAAGAAAIS